jgi:hypothetical protein
MRIAVCGRSDRSSVKPFHALRFLLVVSILTCAKKPEITVDRIASDLRDAATGKIHASGLGPARLTSIRIVSTDVKGSDAWLVADIHADQTALGVQYALSARVRLRYQWAGKDWELKETSEIKPWTRCVIGKRVRSSGNESDSEAVQQLLRARRLARRQLGNIPFLP